MDISAVHWSAYLTRDEHIRPNGFIVEGHSAGGHNAPPRGKDPDGQPAYGAKDEVDLERLAKLGLPFWLAGGQASADALERAVAMGARGVQVGSVFALCAESGFDPRWRTATLNALRSGGLEVRTDLLASSSGYPFKVVNLPGTLADHDVATKRERVCDLGFLREIYERENGKLGYRCPAEPVVRFVRKGGEAAEAEGRNCLCNGLIAAAGFPQLYHGEEEPAIITLGTNLTPIREMVSAYGFDYTAGDVVESIVGQ